MISVELPYEIERTIETMEENNRVDEQYFAEAEELMRVRERQLEHFYAESEEIMRAFEEEVLQSSFFRKRITAKQQRVAEIKEFMREANSTITLLALLVFQSVLLKFVFF